jgi:hypothetical protein
MQVRNLRDFNVGHVVRPVLASTIPHHCRRCLIPIEIRSHISATVAAGATDESRLYVGQPDIIGPTVAADCERMAAAIVSAVDQQPTDAPVRACRQR